MKLTLALILIAGFCFAEDEPQPADETTADESKPLVSGGDAAKMLADIKAKKKAKAEADAAKQDEPKTAEEIAAQQAREKFAADQESQKEDSKRAALKRELESLKKKIEIKRDNIVADVRQFRKRASAEKGGDSGGNILKDAVRLDETGATNGGILEQMHDLERAMSRGKEISGELKEPWPYPTPEKYVRKIIN